MPRMELGARVDRFWSRGIPEPNTGCLLWTAAVDAAGYGRVNWEGRVVSVPRKSYELTHGRIPDGLHVCHRCDTPGCFHPDHLFAGTNAANIADSIAKGRARRHYTGATHCVAGHAFTPENTYVKPNGSRACRECKRRRLREWRARCH